MNKQSINKTLIILAIATVLVALFSIFNPKGVYADEKKYQTATNKLENPGLESMVRRAFKGEMFLEKAENDGWLLYTQTTGGEYKLTSYNTEYITKQVATNGRFDIYATFIPTAELGNKFQASMFIREMNTTKSFDFRIANRTDVSEAIGEFEKAVENPRRPIDGRRYEFIQKNGNQVINGGSKINNYAKINFDKLPTSVNVYNHKKEKIEDATLKLRYVLSYNETENTYAEMEKLKTAVAEIKAQEIQQIKIKTIVVGSDGKEKHETVLRTYQYDETATSEKSSKEVEGIGKEKLTGMQKGIIAMSTILSILAVAGIVVGVVFGIKKKRSKVVKSENKEEGTTQEE